MTPKDLIEWRKANGLSQRQSAPWLNVHWRTVQRWETAQNPIPDWLEGHLKALES